MARPMQPPKMEALKRRIREHRRDRKTGEGMYVRETFCLGREEAREKAREWFDAFPKAAYWTEVESWRRLDGDRVEFTMRRLPSAD